MADIDWGDNKATAATPAPTPSTGSIDWGDASGSPAKLAIDAAAKIPPEQAAKVLRLKGQTGLSTDFVSRNADALQTQQDNAAITPQFSQTAPVTTAHMAEDPHQAALVAPDAGTWGKIEQQLNYMGQREASGALSTESGILKFAKIFGYSGGDERIKQIEMEQQYGLNAQAPGPISEKVGSVFEGIPAFGSALAIGASAPLAATTLGASAATAAAIGSISASTAWGVLGAGDAFHEYSQSKDADGNPISENHARGAAIMTGLAQAAEFYFGGKILDEIPGLKMFKAAGMASIIKSPTLMSGLGSIIADVGKTVPTVMGYSGFADLTKNFYGEMAKIANEGRVPTVAEIIDRGIIQHLPSAGQAALRSIPSGIAFGVGGGGADIASDKARFEQSMDTRNAYYGAHPEILRNYLGEMQAKDIYYVQNVLNAKRTSEGWDAIGKAIEPTVMAQHAPEQVEKFISKMPGADKPVFVPLEAWQSYWDGNKVDPRMAFQAHVGDTKAYDEALRTGVDLQIPAGKYALLAASEHGEHFNSVVKSNPLAMNMEDVEKSGPLQAEAEKEKAKETIHNEIAPQAKNPPEKTAVDETHDLQGIQPLFPQPTAVGMSADQATRYRQAIGEAKVKAQTEVALSIMDAHNRQRSASWNNERDSVQKDVEKDSWQHKEFLAKEILGRPIETKQRAEELRQQAITSYAGQKDRYDAWQEILRSGIKPPEGLKEEWKSIPKKYQDKGGRGYDEVAQEAQERGLMGPNDDIFKTLRELKRPVKPLEAEDYIPQVLQELQPLKLNPNMVKADFPGFDMKSLKGMVSEEVGVHPDQAASVLGFNSGAELLHEIKTTPKRDEWIQEETDQRMMARHPEVGSGFNIVDKAMEAVHNEKRAQVLRMELEHLSSDDFASFKGLTRRIMRPIPTISEVRQNAEEMVGSKTTAETLPSLYQRAESVTGREAGEHFLRGDFEKAFEAKKAELLNHELFRAATNAKEQTTKDMAYQNKFDSDSVMARIGKAGGTYLEQIQAIRDRFDFTKTTLKALERRQSLRDFVEEQKQQGLNPAIPPELLNEMGKKSWREMTNDELHSVVDSMRVIDHLSSLKGKLLASEAGRNLDETKQSIVSAFADRYKITPEMLDKPYDLHPSFMDKVKGDLNTYGAWRTRMEPLFEQLGIHDQIFDPLNKAEDFKTSQVRDATAKLKDIFSVYSKGERAKFGRLTYIPELEGSGISPNLNKMEMIMTLLHGGNEGNMREVMRGYRMTEPQLRAVWSNLEPRDMELAQKTWDFVNSYWPMIAKQERELNGLVPPKVEGRPLDVTLKDGSVHHLEGGYFPLVYDKDVSWRTAALGQDAMAKEMFPSYTSNTATRHNWTEARIGGGGQAPSLKFSVLTNHVFDVIHDLAYRKPIIDAYKLLNDEEVRANIQAGAGKGVYSQMNPWIKRVAGDRQWEPMGPFEAIRTVRSNMTVAELGLKVSSALVHTTSIFPASRELGLGYMVDGFKAFQNIPEATKFMWDKSEFMRSRWEDVGDRDIKSAASDLRLVNPKNGWWAEMKALSPIQQRDAWIVMRAADLAVAGPTWHGAYLKAMDGKVRGIDALDEPSAVDYADQLVRDTKGAGAAKDLAPIQTVGGSFGKLMTMFYTQLNVIDNQMMGAYRQLKVDKNIGKVGGAAVMTWFLPAIAAQLLRGRTPRSDENWLSWGAKTIAKFPFEMMPLAREAMSFYERGKYQISPVEEAVSTILKTGGNIGSTVTGQKDEWTKKDYADAMMTLGYMKGIPTRQVTQSAMRLHGWMSGEEEHDNPLEGAWRVATGTKSSE